MLVWPIGVKATVGNLRLLALGGRQVFGLYACHRWAVWVGGPEGTGAEEGNSGLGRRMVSSPWSKSGKGTDLERQSPRSEPALALPSP